MMSFDVIVKEGGQKKRKTVRKLVDKMFIDEDGSMGRSLLPLYHYCELMLYSN